MKSRIIPLLMTMILLSGSAYAAPLDRSEYSIASGNVAAAAWEDLTAPWSGTLLDFDLEPGDNVQEGALLFRLQTRTLRAPQNGTVTAVFAEAGSDAAAVQLRYGALAAIETENPYIIEASASSAYNKSKNRELHIGETLYFKSTTGDKDDGSGRVVSVTGETYTVEILDGDFSTRENLSLYRSDEYTSTDKVGNGPVRRRDPILITGSGRIEQTLIRTGDRVSADDPLFVLLSADADPGAESGIVSPCKGILASVAVQPGQQVWKGQLLARIYHSDQLEVIADVDEMDTGRIRIGDVCPVLLDMDEQTVLKGRVTEISGLGFTRQNAAYFQVHFALENSGSLPIGASASVYLPKE